MRQGLDVVDQVLALSPADETEAVVLSRASGLTRFANSIIHQNVSEDDSVLMLRVVVDGRVAGYRTNRLTDEGLRDAVHAAMRAARLTPPDPAFPGLADPQPVAGNGRFVERTAAATPADRAERVRAYVQRCGTITAFGALETETLHVALGNSRGVRVESKFSRAGFVSVVDGGDATGYVEAADADLDRLHPEALAQRAVGKVEAGRAPRELGAGRYTVILEPPAVGLMLAFLGFVAINGKAVQEGRSYLTGKLGQRIVDERLTVWDDATDPRTLGIPFDFEGVPRRRLALIERGIARSAVFDLKTAKLMGTVSTGHALPQPNPWGPVPMNLILEPGQTSLDEMIRTTKRGLLVTRFHYVRVVDPLRTVITGMTRDGTFLIEDGRVAGGVKNLRFNQSIIDGLSNLDALGRDGELIGQEFLGHVFAPPLVIRDWNFTGTTTF